jgi:hypothetical protein
MSDLKTELTLTEAIAQTRSVLYETLKLARRRALALKVKPTEEERQETEALVRLLWDSHTKAASIDYRMRARKR